MLRTRYSNAPNRRPHRARRRLCCDRLEDRTTPSFGFGSAFNFGAAGADYGIGAALDTAGNVYVSGMYSGTVDFDPNPTTPASNHVLTSAASYDNFGAKYLANGTFQWAMDLGSNAQGGPGETVAVQGSNVFV